MTWTVMTDVPNPLFDVNGDPYSGAVLKAYLPGTTTSTSIAIDSSGSSPQASITANAEGKWEVSGNEELPYIDRKHKWGIFANATDAAANTPFYMGPFDNVDILLSAASTNKNLATIALMTADASASLGDFYSIEDYATGNNSGILFFKVVASGTGIDDGGKYIDHDTLDVQFEQNMPAILNSKAWGMAESLADNSTKWQNAINFSVIKKQQLLTPAGTYVVKSTIDLPEGAQLLGDRKFKYHDGFGIDPLTTIIDFQPASAIPLFVPTGATHSGFRFHYYFGGMFLKGSGTATIGIDVDAIIYSKFENMAITGFDKPIVCTKTINNTFDNIYMDGDVSCLEYTGTNETTDVWTNCTFFGTPTGIDFKISSIGVRFTNCLFEQLNIGVKIAKECQSIIFDNCYSEDICFDNVSTDSMFQVGKQGTTLVTENNLIVIGGKYSGRNAGTVGSFIDADSSNGIMLSSLSIARFTNGVITTANTRDNSIVVSGMHTLSITTIFDDFDKINGVYPHSNIGDAGASQRFRAPVIVVDEVRQRSTLGIFLGESGGKIGFYGGSPVSKPTVAGSRGGNAALGSLLVSLDGQGILTDNSTA